jgi:nitroimidazol reductase NimA-like FMN-containing flavoprotein (pyridoxamine 5'-phosphate oxidase superfamily)
MSDRPPARVRVRRSPKKGRYDRARIDAILERALVAHVAFVDNGEPVCIPMLFAYCDGRILVHGSTASRAMRLLSRGEPACLTVTLLHGLVLARSAFEHTVNYESVVAFGRFRAITDGEERLAALAAFTNKLVPGRFDEVRAPNAKELKATMVLTMQIEGVSAKVRSGPPDDDDAADAALDVWAGELLILSGLGEAIASPGLRAGISLPDSVRRLRAAMGTVGEGRQGDRVDGTRVKQPVLTTRR